MISRGELRGKILRFLNKSARNPGFYTPDKLNDAIQEVLTYIAVHMFLAGEGWNTKYEYFNTEGGQTSVTLPGNIALIRAVRYRLNDIWYWIPYDDQDGADSYVGSGIEQAFGYRYRILGRQIVFDPPLSQGGERALQIEAVYYPSNILDDNEIIDPQFDAACIEFLKYGVASICAASIEKTVITWGIQQQEWWQLMQSILTRRTMASTPIREFL